MGATDQRCSSVCSLLPLGVWPCGSGHPCTCEQGGTTSATPSTSSPSTSRNPSTTTGDVTTSSVLTSSTGSPPTTTKGSRTGCVATPNLKRGVKDEHCKRCETGY